MTSVGGSASWSDSSHNYNSSSSSDGGFTDNQEEALKIITLVGAILSVVSCCIVMIFGITMPPLRKFKSRLVVYLAFFDLLPACAKLISLASPTPTSPICQAMGYFEQVGGLLGISWAMMIAIAMYLMIAWKIIPWTKIWFNDFTMIAVIAIPLCCEGIIPYFRLGYGADGAVWCWIMGPKAFLYFYPLAWTFIFCTIIIYIMVGRNLVVRMRARKHKGEDVISKKNSQTRSTLLHLAPFPIVVAAIWFWPTVHRIYVLLSINLWEFYFIFQQRLVNDGEDLFALAVLHALVDPSSGFINSVVYSITYYTEIKTTMVTRQCIQMQAVESAEMHLEGAATPSGTASTS
ncbi:hypothetical protein Pelo_2977 [Pelomyxa schiedti]|nr:hypothetical protein Pelo_2977 [Pelomyxa schiedti]